MKTKLSVIALLCCAQLSMGCSASNRGAADIKGVSTAAVLPGCELVSAEDPFRTYRIEPGDQLNISFYLSPEFNQVLTVRPDGGISMPVVGNVRAEGRTPKEFENALDELYSHELKDPRVTVRLDKSPGQVVYVEGQVGKPGAVPLHPGMTAFQAIAASGGMTDAAGAGKVLLIRRDACGNAHGERLKLNEVLNQKDNQEDVALLPADIVMVPRSGIAQFDLNMKQYVRDAMPFEVFMAPPF
ncbi:MAG TPA: polysaccharide biosynthesis/export family protein [Candidatus Acidoferrales bacterium]|nr:polysaccharide biosynthesis/export family protein [Candidatus Acidoferrales bacterium]